tara:strand:+ start:672 stop:1337 length:666 start_codon:yes stop_codon:yes gene_type:complete
MGGKMNKLYAAVLLFISFQLGAGHVYAQNSIPKPKGELYIQPKFGFDFGFFYPKANRMEEISTRDIEEFLAYTLELGYVKNSTALGVSFSIANDIDAWDRNQSSLPKGYRYFDSYYEFRLSLSKTLYSFGLTEKRQLSMGGITGISYRKYKGHESLGAAESFRTKEVEPADALISLGVVFALEPKINFKVPFIVNLQLLAVNVGFEATTYEFSRIGVAFKF